MTKRALQYDNGGLFKTFTSYLTTHGITHRSSCPCIPKQNGRAERKMRHLVETDLTLLTTASLPLQFWIYAFHTTTHPINRLPTKVLQFQSHFQVLFNKIPNYYHLKVFDCLCYPYFRPYNKHKLCYRSSPCVFLGYSPTHKGYMCFDFNSNRIYITRHVKFHETKFPFQQTVNTSSASSSSQFTSTPTLLPIPLSTS